MENETIPDNHITASTSWSDKHKAANARLHFTKGDRRKGAWLAKDKNRDQWLQVDLGSLALITRIATQGRQDLNVKDREQWIESYNISYSLDGKSFHSYRNGKVLNTITRSSVDSL